MALLLPAMLMAQVSLYQWSESFGTYTPLTEADDPLVLGLPEYWPHVFRNRAWVNNPYNDPGGQVTQSGYLNPAEGPGYPIGFDFTFNSDVFDRIGISNGGWISFGKSADNLQAVWVYNWGGTQVGDPLHQPFYNPTPSYRRNRVAGFGNSGLQQVNWSSLMPPGPKSSIKMATIGTAPNRVCVVEWFDYGLSGDVTVAINLINFQIRLYEADNSIEVHFGNMDWVSTLGRYTRTQIGLGGQTNADYNGRMTVYEQPAFVYDWTNTVPMDTSNAACTIAVPQPGMPNNSGIQPVDGTVWRWVMPVCPPPAWPQTISDITFEGAHATWQDNGAAEWEWTLTQTNDPEAEAIASDVTTDTEAWFEELEASSTYYFFVRSICDGEPGPWSMANKFTTLGGAIVLCNGTAIEEIYCSHQYDTKEWLYVSPTNDAIQIDFLGGYIGTVSGESFTLWDGIPGQGGTQLTGFGSGDLTGQTRLVISGMLYMKLVTEAGACEAQDWYLPLHWKLGCKNCTDPLVSFSVAEDCDNDQYSVDVDMFSMGSATSITLSNTLNVPSTTITATGVHTVGPFPAGSPVYVTVENDQNVMCYANSPLLVNVPCVEEICEPTEFTQCYGYNEFHQWAYKCACEDEQVAIRFFSGTVGYSNTAYWFDGADPGEAGSEQLGAGGFWGGLANRFIASNNTDHALVLQVESGNEQSCTDPNGTYGASEPWHYIVGCHNGCTQPKGTLNAADTLCLDETQFELLVNVTDLGSTGTVEITNDAGAPSLTVSQTGIHHAGPFASGTPVSLALEGGSIFCTFELPARSANCSSVGIGEISLSRLALFPNPNNGTFSIELPEGLAGTSHLSVLDVTGRTVAQRPVQGTGKLAIELPELPNGLYTVLLENNDNVFNGRISIQK